MGNLPSYYFQTHGNAEQILKLHNQIKKKKNKKPTIKQTTKRKSPGPQNKERTWCQNHGE